MTQPVILAVLSSILPPILAMTAFRLSVERLWPITPARPRQDGLNILAFLITFTTQLLSSPGLFVVGTLLANHLGGGLIVLPERGWGQIVGFLVFFLVADLAQYLFHRAEHAIPWLWSMHSLHHADTTLDATTSVLHHWMLALIGSFMVTIPMGLLFKVPPVDALIYSVLSYHGYLIHSNLRLNFGRFSWLLNAPAFHRLHHSVRPEHFGCNYAATLPIFDVIFGTYRPARPGEWPKVGLGYGREPRGIFDLVFWPVREPARTWLKLPLEAPDPHL